YILFSNYDRQVQALVAGQIDVAWNTNLAWVKLYRKTSGTCRALAMRDVDAQFTTIFVTRTDRGIQSLGDLRGKRLALGSADSAQAAILPAHFLREAGIELERDRQVMRFDLDVGKHGDTGTSELEVLRALREGQADAGVLGDTTWIRQVAEGHVDTHQVKPFWTSPGYCHCNFSVLAGVPEELGQRWPRSLVQMNYANPRWRALMDMEGLKRWLQTDPAILKGYQVLFDAVEQQGLARDWQL